MSRLTITYSRAVRVGDFVRIGDVEGTITQLGTLSTKVKTPRREEVTIPNAVVMGQVTTNYSRFSDTGRRFRSDLATIGYDAPWRQVQRFRCWRPNARPVSASIPTRSCSGPPWRISTCNTPLFVSTTCAALPDARLVARQHPRCLQRIRRADHLAELRSRSRGAQGRARGPVVCGSRPAEAPGGRRPAGRRSAGRRSASPQASERRRPLSRCA